MSENPSGLAWPAHQVERREWRQSVRGGSREDRMLSHVDTSVPPTMSALTFTPSPGVLAACERAVVEIATTDADARSQSRALGRFLIRTESVASSKIEQIVASPGDYARALAGSRANSSAVSMVAASAALYGLVERAGGTGQITIDDLLAAHRALMADDPSESAYAGRVRDMQNWIGGSNHSPRGALYVPPAPEHVERLLADLIEWANREDMPVLVQAAIAHAQFESIHPFTDGNGRIGRALISAILRRRGVARGVVLPLASGILAVRDSYFAALTRYRQGDPAALIEMIAWSAEVAAVESRTSMEALRALPTEWRALVPAREGSAAARLIDAFFDNPVLTADEILTIAGGAHAAAYRAIDKLTDAGIVAEITGRKRDRVWAAGDALGELEELDRRIHARLATSPS